MRDSRHLASVALGVGLLLASASSARAQETFPDLSGTWWLELGGADRGALLIAFSDPHDGTLVVSDTAMGLPSFGFSRELGAFFEVAAGQTLSFDSKGDVFGTLELTDQGSSTVIGSLTGANIASVPRPATMVPWVVPPRPLG